MSATSWFRFAKLHFPSPATNSSRRKAPTRPCLECLEERAVPDAASTNILGNLNNATLNGNLPNSGLVLSSNPASAALNAVALSTFFNGLALNQGQQGLAVANILSNVPTSIIFGSFGFGSGTQSNQPWVPNAYNLGLANGQGAFPTIADFGSFQRMGGPYPRLSRLPQPNNDANPPKQLLPPRDALTAADADQTDTPDALLQEEEDADNPLEIDSDIDSMFRPIPIVPHADTEDLNVAQTAMKKQASAVEEPIHAARPTADIQGENAADEQLLQAWRLTVPEEPAGKENVFLSEKPAEPADEAQFLDSDLLHDVPALESLNLPSTLLLTVLTPAQLMVLMAEFPVATVPPERGEDLAEFSEPE